MRFWGVLNVFMHMVVVAILQLSINSFLTLEISFILLDDIVPVF